MTKNTPPLAGNAMGADDLHGCAQHVRGEHACDSLVGRVFDFGTNRCHMCLRRCDFRLELCVRRCLSPAIERKEVQQILVHQALPIAKKYAHACCEVTTEQLVEAARRVA